MNRIEKILNLKKISFYVLSKKDGYKIYHSWLEQFANEVKQQTGKYTTNGFVWGAYWSGLIPSLDGDEGIQHYQSKDTEDFYIIYENGNKVLSCGSCTWPNLFSTEAIVFPKSKEWSMVFSHEETMHYVEQTT